MTVTTVEPIAPDARRQVAHARASGRARTLRVGLILLAVTFLAFCVNISVGDFPIALPDVVPALLGLGDDASVIVAQDLRLPRTAAGLLVGLAFGLAGGIFQAVLRNPLASPDILGIMYGGSVGAVFVFTAAEVDSDNPALEYGSSFAALFAAAFLGSVILASLVYVLAYRQGVSPYRFVLVGIGLAFIATAVIQYLLTRADVFSAAIAFLWLTGSLNAVGWESVVPTAVGLVVLTAAALALTSRLRTLQLGDDAAQGLGVGVERSRLLLVLVGVALAGLGTATAGPIAFVAFMAPPIARRLTGAPLALVPSALAGAVLVLLADLVGRQAVGSTEIPVGVITGIVGGPYFLWLLAQANRIGRGG